MKTFNMLLRKVIMEGIVPPVSKRFINKQEKEQIETTVIEQLSRLYQDAVKAGVPENFKLDTADKKQLLNALLTIVGKEVVAASQVEIGRMIKDFEFAVNNSGRIKALVENSSSAET